MWDGIAHYALALQSALSAPTRTTNSVTSYETGGEIFAVNVNNHPVKTGSLVGCPKYQKVDGTILQSYLIEFGGPSAKPQQAGATSRISSDLN